MLYIGRLIGKQHLMYICKYTQIFYFYEVKNYLPILNRFF